VKRASTEADDLSSPPELRVQRFALGGDELALVSFDLAPPRVQVTSRLARLTQAEREVAALAVEGLSDLEIAHARGRSPRTIQGQLATLYRKLEVQGRRELRAALATGRTFG
jgi:DNA-binding CsgD family transcriptional regulator